MSWKHFTHGEILTADDANTLMDQGRIIVANTAERDVIAGKPGMQVYRLDNKTVEEYTGVTWVSREEKKRIISAALMAPRFGAPTFSSAGAVPFPHWSLDGAGATESVNVFAEVPANWATYNAKLVGVNETAGAGDIRLMLGVNVLNETGAIDGASQVSFSTTVTASATGVAHVIDIGTGLPRPASGISRLSIQRNSADAADTLPADWAVCWIQLTKAS